MQNTNFTVTDKDREVFENEIRGWLPPRVLDAHVHVLVPGMLPAGHELPPKSCYRKVGSVHTAAQCRDIAAAVLPDVDFSMVAFGHPGLEVNRATTARYLGGVVDNERVFGLDLVAPADRPEEIRARIMENRLVGYKPYRNLVTGKDAEAVTIPDMLPAAQMELANELGLAITLHIPRAGRLADPENQREIVALCETYPQAQIILAHIGRAYYMECVTGQLDAIAACPNAYVDLAMVNHAGVLEYTFRHFPRDRILFGSDAPIAWLYGKSVEINNQYAYLMGEDYAIGTAIYDAAHAVRFTFFYYEILRGIKEAAERTDMNRAELSALFYDTAHALFSGIAARLHG